MQVGPADAARRDADSYFAGVRFPVGKVAQRERLPGTIEYHRTHQKSSLGDGCFQITTFDQI
jgi:hypothetical protein